mmetsp:Transcript_13225/g.31558  ORF Transcript_13225/g.31558 Transcript_13225/m.31558 type:complete len:209 (-) Transcript_13225:123-749(-)
MRLTGIPSTVWTAWTATAPAWKGVVCGARCSTSGRPSPLWASSLGPGMWPPSSTHAYRSRNGPRCRDNDSSPSNSRTNTTTRQYHNHHSQRPLPTIPRQQQHPHLSLRPHRKPPAALPPCRQASAACQLTPLSGRGSSASKTSSPRRPASPHSAGRCARALCLSCGRGWPRFTDIGGKPNAKGKTATRPGGLVKQKQGSTLVMAAMSG